MKKHTTIPSPKSGTLHLQDSDIPHHYCELPEDTIFCESIAHNPQFRNGVGFLPVQRIVKGRKETHVYEMTSKSKVATHIAGPILAPDGSRDITVFGSALNSSGILYLCAFNRNSILALDLNQAPTQAASCDLEIRNIPAPNDVAIDPSDENILYTAGGTYRNLLLVLPFTNAAAGRIYKTVLSSSSSSSSSQRPKTTVVANNLKTLAGIEVTDDGQIFTAQLFNMVSRSKTSRSKRDNVVRWNGEAKKNRVWLADNVDRFGDNGLICPAYMTASKAAVNLVLRRSAIASGAIFIGQALSALVQGERLRAALRDPELSLKFSNTFIQRNDKPEPIRFFTMDTEHGTAQHYEIDLVKTRAQNKPRTIRHPTKTKRVMGQRHFFNEQVTHMAHLDGAIVCVNFEQPRVLVLDDSMFQQPKGRGMMAQAM